MEQSVNSRYMAQLEELTRLMSFFNEKAEKAAQPTLIEKFRKLEPANSRGQLDYKKYAAEIDPVLALAMQDKPDEAKKLLRQIAQAYIAEAQDVRKGVAPAHSSDQVKEAQLKKEREKKAQRHELFARKIAETMVKF